MAKEESVALLVLENEQPVQYGSVTVNMDDDTDTDTDTDTSSDRQEDETQVQIETETQNAEMGELKALMNILKGNIGTGVLAMPFAISSVGLAVGPVGMLVMGFIALICTHLLVHASREQTRRARAAGDQQVMTYANLMASTMATAHPVLRGWPAVWGRRFVNALLMVSQLGFCSIYVVFVATNIKETVQVLVPNSLPQWVYQVGTGLLLIPYCQIKQLKTLAPFCAVANVLTVICLAIVFVSFFSGGLPEVSELPAFTGWSNMATFFSTAVFAFEGISLVLPLHRQVRNKERFGSRCGVLTLSMTVVVCLYTAMGFFGYLAHGHATLPAITLNLPSHPWYYLVVKPGFSVVMFLSYNLQLYVPVDITISCLPTRCTEHGHHGHQGHQGQGTGNTSYRAERIVRVFFVILTLLVSIVVPKLDLLIAFVGAFASSFLALCLPASIYLATILTSPHPQPVLPLPCPHSDLNSAQSQPVLPLPCPHSDLNSAQSQPHSRAQHVLRVIGLVVIIVIGLAGFGVGTYTSVRDIVVSL